jgi:hypothetical protein
MTQPNAPTEVNWFFAIRPPNGRPIVWVFPLAFDGTKDTPDRGRGLSKAMQGNPNIDPALHTYFSQGWQSWMADATLIDWTKGVPA